MAYLSSSLRLYARSASCGHLTGRRDAHSRSQSNYLYQRGVVCDDGDRSSPLVRTKRAGQRALPSAGAQNGTSLRNQPEQTLRRCSCCRGSFSGGGVVTVCATLTFRILFGKGHRHPLEWPQATPRMRRTTTVNLASVSSGTARTPESCRTSI